MEITRIKEKNSLHTFIEQYQIKWAKRQQLLDNKKGENEKANMPIWTYPLYCKEIFYKDYSAFASSAATSVAGASASTFFVERRLRRVFLASALGVLAIFSS